MFAATLTLAIDGVDKVLNRINQDNKGSEYSFVSDTESISMLIRHSVDKLASGNVNRHNVFIERTVFATPTVIEKYWSTTFTLRDRVGAGPTSLLHLYVGASALMATMDQDLVVGVN